MVVESRAKMSQYTGLLTCLCAILKYSTINTKEGQEKTGVNHWRDNNEAKIEAKIWKTWSTFVTRQIVMTRV